MTETRAEASAYGAPFWAGCEHGELLVQECADCGQRIFPPEPACPGCLGGDLTWIASRLTGTVYSFSIVYRSPGPAHPAPYVLAVIDMDDGWSLLSNIQADTASGSAFEAVASGTRVQAEFAPKPDGTGTMPVFRVTAREGCQ
jgi:uncharacterized OB-fold protein